MFKRKVRFSDKVKIYYYPRTDNINYFLIDKQRFKDRCLRFEKLYIKSLVVKNGNSNSNDDSFSWN